MKHFFSIMFLLLSLEGISQEIQPTINNNLRIAKALLNAGSPAYDPQRAYELYLTEASSGNAEAMNALGILYSKGMGTALNTEEALQWFKKAAESGYKNAWYNLANMYRTGSGTAQDFNEAYRIFAKGAALGVTNCIYSVGYLHYKGLGCEQSYDKAVFLFRQTANKGHIRSMFMLGLCHRNGYGIAQNIDSARYWISRSANMGYQPAKNELQEEEAENISYKEVPQAKGKNKPATLTTVSSQKAHSLSTGTSITGKYQGYVLKYDWSGRYIVSKKKLEVQLQHDERTGKITGKWTENDTLSTDIAAQLTDTALVFEDSFYRKVDHYSAKKAVPFDFKDAHLQLTRQKDTLSIAGNLQLWSWQHNEPEKPMYVSLTKMDESSESFEQADKLVVYPNPFVNSLSFNLTLDVATKINVTIADMTGRILHSETVDMPKGQHSHTLQVKAASGVYVLRVNYNGKVQSALVVKQ